jgi:hypothetical protein
MPEGAAKWWVAKVVVRGLLRGPAVQGTSAPGEPEGKLPKGDHVVNGLTVRRVGAAPEKVHVAAQLGSRLILKLSGPGLQAYTPAPVDETVLSAAQLAIVLQEPHVPKAPPAAAENRTGCPCVSVPTPPAVTVLAEAAIDVTIKARTETVKPAYWRTTLRVPTVGEPLIVHKLVAHEGSVLNLKVLAVIPLPGFGQANTPPPEDAVESNVAQLVIPEHPPHVASSPPEPVK